MGFQVKPNSRYKQRFCCTSQPYLRRARRSRIVYSGLYFHTHQFLLAKSERRERRGGGDFESDPRSLVKIYLQKIIDLPIATDRAQIPEYAQVVDWQI